jgi:hypothetical protein
MRLAPSRPAAATGVRSPLQQAFILELDSKLYRAVNLATEPANWPRAKNKIVAPLLELLSQLGTLALV